MGCDDSADTFLPRIGSFVGPLSPIAGQSLVVCKREYDELGGLDEVDEPVGEAGHAARSHRGDAVPARPDRSGLRPIHNRADNLVDGRFEAIAEPGAAVLVPRDVGTKLGESLWVISNVEGHCCCRAARSAAS